ncbi:KIFC2_3 [Mytilus coruscus]|uniref:KIFC2_3 n=1 Tax=Mytilus coruscus TaxID=42192 RepID=A0A6J8DJH1_MYTCO|nr:KIFC2_3 [Mytilus coruscus]
MATADLGECENICVELLHCTQCEKWYDQSSHQPRILPCLHTICTDCLMKHFHSNFFKCPVCQKSVDIKDTFESSKDKFPIDFTIRDRIEFVDTFNQNKSSICDFCDESKTATYRCKDCESYICETCIRFHNKSSKFKNHVTCNLSEAIDVSKFSHEVFCTKDGHENRPLEIFCTGDGCKRPVCNMCFVIDHSDSGDHQAKDVLDVFILEMKRIFDKYKETEELGHEIKEELDSFQNEILTSKVFLQQSSLSKNAPAFLASVSSVDKQLDKIKETEFARQPSHIANMKFIDDIEQSERIFEHLGILLISTADPYTSEIENPKIMYAKTDGIFEVRLKDNQGRPVKDQSIYMEISFLDENTGQEFTFPFTVAGANGCFKAKCAINSQGTYHANVVINGKSFFKLDTISCLEHDPEENSSDFVSEKQIEKEITENLNVRGCKDLQGEEKEISKYSFNVKPNNDTAEKNKKSNLIIKKGKVEENKETGTGRSQEISEHLKVSGCKDLQKEEIDISKDSSNVKPNKDKNEKITPQKKKYQFEKKKTTGTEGLQGQKEIVFETFYHRSGREFQCMYLNGMRFYLDDWGSKEWQPFPKRWYQEGLLITNTVVKDAENEPQTESTVSADKDHREGVMKHPRKGKIPTYIFQRKHNIHFFYDHDTGGWMRMPIGYELHHERIIKLLDQIEKALPGWNDRNDILAMLRQCNYDADECIRTYIHLEEDEWMRYTKIITDNILIKLLDSAVKLTTVSSLRDQGSEPVKRGRNSLTSMFPNTVPTGKDLIEEHGYQADSRRRCDTP